MLFLFLLVGVTLSDSPSAARPVLTALRLRPVQFLKRWEDFPKVGEGLCPAEPSVHSVLAVLLPAPVFQIKMTPKDPGRRGLRRFHSRCGEEGPL